LRLAYLATTVHDLGLGKTNARVRLQHVLRDDATAVDIALLLLLGAMAVLGLEVLDEGILLGAGDPSQRPSSQPHQKKRVTKQTHG